MWKTKLILFLVLFTIIFGIWYLINANSNYVDAMSFCRIRINGDILRGNKDTIKQALKRIKATDIESYETICNYVNNITESYCVDSDHNLDISAAQAGFEWPGCFIKGSKTIYLKPESINSQEIVLRRTAVIKKYASYSKKYWDNLAEK